jgi:hypothetical protein
LTINKQIYRVLPTVKKYSFSFLPTSNERNPQEIASPLKNGILIDQICKDFNLKEKFQVISV